MENNMKSIKTLGRQTFAVLAGDGCVGGGFT
jgi:hypothetical protein